MAKLWRKATFPTIEELVKEVGIKKNLTQELRNSIRNLISEQIGNENVIQNGDTIENVCTALEAIFIHGLKGKFSARMVSMFSANTDVKIPEPDFWPVVSFFTHKDVISAISAMKQVNTDVGRCRAWLRVAINDGLLCSYLDTMLSDKSTLQNYYSSVAYLRDDEQPEIMKQVLASISLFSFKLPCNSTTLNIWSSTPLVLAGIWTPPAIPQPVMPAIDVIEFFSEQDMQNNSRTQNLTSGETEKTEKSCSGYQVVGESTNGNTEIHLKEETEQDNVNSALELPTSSEFANEIVLESENIGNEHEHDTSDGSSQYSIPDFKNDCTTSLPSEISKDRASGNRLWLESANLHSGWSSQIECSVDEDNDQESYDSLLQNYNKSRPISGVLVGTPDLSEMMMSRNESTSTEEKIIPESASIESHSSISDYEVIPKSYLLYSGGSDDRVKLLSHIGFISTEKGLDTQNYECHGCGCHVGMLYGKAYPCAYDGYNYCTNCYSNDEYYIPARIVHNWDFKKYPIAKYTKTFLAEVENQPLLDLKSINPLIYTVVEEMNQILSLRTQLTFLRSYIFTCNESIIEELRKKIWPREHLYEHIHLYSLEDLLQCYSKTLYQTLQKVIVFAKKHVLGCQLCSSKAFICEICSNPKILYPFDIEEAYHCDKCLAVYHRDCIEVKKFCPKCERKRKRLEVSSNSVESF